LIEGPGGAKVFLYVLEKRKGVFTSYRKSKLEGPGRIPVITTRELSVYKYVTTAMLVLSCYYCHVTVREKSNARPCKGLVSTQPVEESVWPVKQHLGRERFHSNEEVEMAIRECLRLMNLLGDDGEK
jgi:hypothetical protein